MGKVLYNHNKIPASFDKLVAMMPPQAITDDVHLENSIEIIDQLMAMGKLTKDQQLYLETLTQLVEAYETKHYAVKTEDISGLDSLKYLLKENDMSGYDLAMLLGIDASMGPKILNGQRQLTANHLRKLSSRFHVDASLFL